MGQYRAVSTAPKPAALVVLLVAALSGCAYPRAVRTYEYVTSYDRMSEQYDPLVSLLYVPEQTAFAAYRGVIVGTVGVGDSYVESPDEAAGYTTFFRVALASELLKLHRFQFVGLDKDPASVPGGSLDGMLLVEGVITKFHMGSGALRYLSHFLMLRLGATDLQIEGRITEAGSGRLVAEFVDRRHHLCNTPFGPDPRNFRKGYGMKVTARA